MTDALIKRNRCGLSLDTFCGDYLRGEVHLEVVRRKLHRASPIKEVFLIFDPFTLLHLSHGESVKAAIAGIVKNRLTYYASILGHTSDALKGFGNLVAHVETLLVR